MGRYIKNPRKHFYLKNLKDGTGFSRWEMCIFYAQYIYYKDTDHPILSVLNKGWNYHSSIILNINSLNSCFYRLIKEGEYNTALPLLRLQLDNLSIIYAETLYPEKILPNVLEKGTDLKDIKVNGEYLRPSKLIDKLSEKYSSLKQIWDTSCGYVHPSKGRQEATKVYLYDSIKHRYYKDKEKQKNYLLQMVLINQVILDVMNLHLDSYITKIKEKGTYKEYCEAIR